MSFMDWFWAAVAAALGWAAAPFIFIAAVLALLVVSALIYVLWLWLKDFCATAKDFFLFCIGRGPW